MTTGEQLIKDLGLQKFPHPRIHHLVDGAYRVYFIYVDSSSPGTLITKNTLKTWLPKVGAYKYPFTDRGGILSDKTVATTPLMDLQDWNGNLSPGDFILVDLAGRFGKQNRYIWEGRLPQLVFSKDSSLIEVTLPELKDIGASDLTMKFSRERNKTTGKETSIAKFLGCELLQRYKNDTPSIHALFTWWTPITHKYPPGHVAQQAAPDGTLSINTKGFYYLQLEVEDVNQWLNTYPNKKEVTVQDMKDILKVADVKIWSEAPSFYWQGMAANLTHLDAAIYPVDIDPKFWNQSDRHGDVYFLDKHLRNLIAGIGFWYSPMAAMLTRQLRLQGHLS